MTPPYILAQVAVNCLRLDPKNPRLPPSVDAARQEDVLTFMLDDASLTDLAGSIATQSFFPGEPLLVCPEPELSEEVEPLRPQEGDQYTVVEGNRRLAAVLLLRKPEDAPRRRKAFEALAATATLPDELPSIIFPTRDSILDYLGYRHITGIKEWDPFAKARYLVQVRERWTNEGRDATNRDLARVIGSTAPYVGRLLSGVAAVNRLTDGGFFVEHGADPEQIPFSLFTAALNHEHIPQYMGFQPDDPELSGVRDSELANVAKWLFVPIRDDKTALEDSRNMRHLDTAVQSERAIAALEAGATVREAARLAFGAAEVFSAALAEADRNAQLALRHIDEVEMTTSTDVSNLGSIHRAADEMLARIERGEPG